MPHASRHDSSDSDKEKSSPPVPSPTDEVVDRGRSRIRRPSNQMTEQNMRKRGYHSFMSSFGKAFYVEKRWKLVREMGSGAYGYVVSAADEISGETVAIKLVTRIFERVQLAKRALREITLLRHFANHENITGLIDVDAISPDFQEIYIFMEPMEADLHQIIKSGQHLSNEHVQYFLYQVLRGVKYIHSANVIHRDLKPGNLLVNSDCELKICDFGLSRGFEANADEQVGNLTEYVATRWYRAPEIMLAFRNYTTAIDVWSIGCIFAELLLGRPLFKGKDYVDQLNKILDVLGTPDESIYARVKSEKAVAYVRSLPIKKKVPLRKIIPSADIQALDLLTKMLSFDPATRISVTDALQHPWLASYHDESDEPDCHAVFDKWRQIEQLETLQEFREALWNEIEDYRAEVRGLKVEVVGATEVDDTVTPKPSALPSKEGKPSEETKVETSPEQKAMEPFPSHSEETHSRERTISAETTASLPTRGRPVSVAPTDPVVSYSRRTSVIQPSRQNSMSSFQSPFASHRPLSSVDGLPPPSTDVVMFPTQTDGYVVPARSRASSTITGDASVRRLLRTLSTVSIHESREGLPGGLEGFAPIGKYITEPASDAEVTISEVPEFGGEDEQ